MTTIMVHVDAKEKTELRRMTMRRCRLLLMTMLLQ